MTSQALEYEGKIEQLEESLEGLGKSRKAVTYSTVQILKSNFITLQCLFPYGLLYKIPRLQRLTVMIIQPELSRTVVLYCTSLRTCV
jgi:hypothetical protein